MGIDVISPENIIQQKKRQITEYYFLHKKIKYILESKYNPFEKCEDKLYIIDSHWINLWKKYSNYLNAQKNFDEVEIYDKKELIKNVEEMCQNMINTDEINFNGVIPPPMNNEIEENFFCNKLIYNLEDLDCLINKNNYRSFQELSKSNIISKNMINLFINQDFLFLIFEAKLKIKCFCKVRNNLIQTTIDFNSSTLKDQKELHKIFYNFIEFRIKKKNDEDFKKYWNSFFEEKYADLIAKTPIEDEYGHYILRNDCLFLKTLSLDEKIINNINFNNINYGRLIGFENIRIINYMNATLQCLINTDILTEYLLNEKIFMNINKNRDKYELSSIYCDLLANVFCIQNTNCYDPITFKELLIAKEYSFNKFEARDSKDLIKFILEEMNCELSRLENKKSDEKIMDEILTINQNDEKIMLNYFLYQFKTRNSKISEIFCSINKNQIQCLTCLDTIYNYESCYIFDFILSLVEDYYQKNNIYINENNGIITIPLSMCFKFYFSVQYFSVYSYCKKCDKNTYKNQKIQIISLSPTIIISLYGNGDSQSKYKVDFPEILNLKEFVTMSYGDSRYQLKAVISKLNREKCIAYCRKQIDNNKWYCYNDNSVTCCYDQKNDFKNGIAYILFYESISNKQNNIFFDKYINEKINNMNNFNNTNNQFKCINNEFNRNNFNNNSNNFMLNNNQMNNFNNNNNIFNQMNNNNNNICNQMNNMGQMNNFNNNNIFNQMNNNNVSNQMNYNNVSNQMNNYNNNNIFNQNNNMRQINNYNNNNNICNQMNNMRLMNNNNNICNQMDNMGQMNNNNEFLINFTKMNNIFIDNQVTNRISQFNIFNNPNLSQTNNINDINNNYNFRTQYNFNNCNNNRQRNMNLNKKNNINNNALNRSFSCNNIDSMNQMFNINSYIPHHNNNNPNYYNNNQNNQNNYSSNTFNQRNQNSDYSNKIKVMNEMKNKMRKK